MASDRQISNAGIGRPGPFPKMDGALAGWTSPLAFKLITDTIVNFENVKAETSYPFEGCFQPMSSRDLYLKPEGERNWKWWTLFTRTQYAISNGDIIEDYNGLRFRVMRSNDWSQAGFYRFDLLEDYVEHE